MGQPPPPVEACTYDMYTCASLLAVYVRVCVCMGKRWEG
jgi:hypothetical protein